MWGSLHTDVMLKMVIFDPPTHPVMLRQFFLDPPTHPPHRDVILFKNSVKFKRAKMFVKLFLFEQSFIT